MVIVYLTSSASRTGKTAIAAVLGKHFKGQGKAVAYLRVTLSPDSSAHSDSALLRNYLGLDTPEEDMIASFADQASLKAGIGASLSKLSASKDLVIIEGPSGQGRLASDLASSVNCRIVDVESFSSQPSSAYYSPMAKQLVGVILNKVPRKLLTDSMTTFRESFPGVRLLGVLPEVRALYSLSIEDLAEKIGGDILGNKDQASRVIENIMVGAMNPDHGPDYYSLRDNKAVVVRADRPDMQLAALETQTAVIVLAGGTPPIAMVTMRAQANRVPLISARSDVKTILQTVETALGNNTLTEAKATLFAALVQEQLDVQTLFKDLGVPG